MVEWWFSAVGAALRRDCFEVVQWGRGIKPLLLLIADEYVCSSLCVSSRALRESIPLSLLHAPLGASPPLCLPHHAVDQDYYINEGRIWQESVRQCATASAF